MLPAARVASAIELLDHIHIAWRDARRIPVDRLIDQFFKQRRFIGSKDRAFIGELVYWVLRHHASLGWWIQRGGGALLARAYIFTALIQRGDHSAESIDRFCNGDKFMPLPLLEEEKQLLSTIRATQVTHPDMPRWDRLNYQQWLDALLSERFGNALDAELLAMNEQAPVDLRTNSLKITRDELLARLRAEGFEAAPIPNLSHGIRLHKRGPLFASPLFQSGYFEMQDAGSQMLAALCDVKPGQKVIDFCAGAGGKTLALAAMMENKGRILAWDISAKRMEQMPQRLRRAGVHNVQTHVITSEQDSFIKRHKASADCVLVDAPCSGTGTWRRNPDLKWRFSEEELENLLTTQQSILRSAARLVKKGGKLIYATCSVLPCENQEQINAFLHAFANFRVVTLEKMWDKTPPDRREVFPFLATTPHQDGTDGFFAAVLEQCDA